MEAFVGEGKQGTKRGMSERGWRGRRRNVVSLSRIDNFFPLSSATWRRFSDAGAARDPKDADVSGACRQQIDVSSMDEVRGRAARYDDISRSVVKTDTIFGGAPLPSALPSRPSNKGGVWYR